MRIWSCTQERAQAVPGVVLGSSKTSANGGIRRWCRTLQAYIYKRLLWCAPACWGPGRPMHWRISNRKGAQASSKRPQWAGQATSVANCGPTIDVRHEADSRLLPPPAAARASQNPSPSVKLAAKPAVFGGWLISTPQPSATHCLSGCTHNMHLASVVLFSAWVVGRSSA